MDDKIFDMVDIFSDLGNNDRECLRGMISIKKAFDGDVLFYEGDKGSELFIVISGSVTSSITTGKNSSKVVRVIMPGDFFGEMAIFENAPRSAMCAAEGDSELAVISGADFAGLMKSHPVTANKIMYRILLNITQRMKNTGSFLSEMMRWGESARKRTITDEMTGAYNRRYFDDIFPVLFERIRGESGCLSMIMIDLDFFREINESYGHDAGDSAILEIVHVIKSVISEKDIFSRYGGDEFTLLLPEKNRMDACRLGETIRGLINSSDLLEKYNGPVKRLSISMGVASFPECVSTARDLKEKADSALYRAKQLGRNRVECIINVKV